MNNALSPEDEVYISHENGETMVKKEFQMVLDKTVDLTRTDLASWYGISGGGFQNWENQYMYWYTKVSIRLFKCRK